MIHKLNHKAQEEVVGFVMIIVLVAVIFTIFLGIMIHNTKRDNSYTSIEYTQFISALMEVNTPCVVYSPAHAKVSDLIGYCIDSQQCLDGSQSCSVLNKTLSDALSNSILVGPDRAIKGYSLSIIYNTTSSLKSIMTIEKGLCNSSSLVGSDQPLYHQGGVFTTTIKVCS